MNRLLLPLALFLCFRSMAQYKTEHLFYYDVSGRQVKPKEATLMRQLVQLNDTLWETNLYPTNKPRTISFQCSTDDGRLLNGRYITYDAVGHADTIGYYSAGKRVGIWLINTDLQHGGMMIAKQFYSNGELLWQKDTVRLNQERDSLRGRSPAEEIRTKVEIESTFPGGAAAWLRYMNKNLRYPDEAVEKKLMGITVVGFVVDTTGDVEPTSLWLDRSVAYSIDKESLRCISQSGQWTPAIQDGKAVRSYKKQPIIYKLQVFGR